MKNFKLVAILLVAVLITAFGVTKAFAMSTHNKVDNISEMLRERALANEIIAVRVTALKKEYVKLSLYKSTDDVVAYYSKQMTTLEDYKVKVNDPDIGLLRLKHLVREIYTNLRINKLVLHVFDDVIIPGYANIANYNSYYNYSNVQEKALYEARFVYHTIDNDYYLQLHQQWVDSIVYALRDYNSSNTPKDGDSIKNVIKITPENYNDNNKVLDNDTNIIKTNKDLLSKIKAAQDKFDRDLQNAKTK